MKKSFLILAGLIALFAAIGVSRPTFAASAPEFSITKINPSENSITMLYKGDDKNIKYLNIAYINSKTSTPDEIEKYHYTLGMARPYWSITIYLSYIQFGNKILENGTETTFSGSKIMNDISEDQYGVIHYSLIFWDDTEELDGVVDYSRCLKSSVYTEGVECVAETTEKGTIFRPYLNGVRLDIPEESKEVQEKLDPEVEPELEPEPEIAQNTEKTEKIAEKQIVSEYFEEVKISNPEMGQSELRTPAPETDQIKQNYSAENKVTDTNFEEEQTEIETPNLGGFNKNFWWILVPVLGGIGILLWWFLPVVKRKRKKD